jgi:flagellar basal body P-ring protein FlgI
MTYERQIRNSKNKVRTTWNLINREVHNKVMKENIQTLNIEGKNDTNLNNIVEVFNKYFSGVADTIHKQIKENCKDVQAKLTNYMAYMSMDFESSRLLIQRPRFDSRHYQIF